MITIISALATIVGAVGGMSLILLPQIRKLDREITATRDELKGDIAGLRTDLRAEIAEVRKELKAVRTELKADIAGVRDELKADISGVRTELKADISGARDEQTATRVAMTDRVARVEGRVFGLPFPEAAADPA